MKEWSTDGIVQNAILDTYRKAHPDRNPRIGFASGELSELSFKLKGLAALFNCFGTAIAPNAESLMGLGPLLESLGNHAWMMYEILWPAEGEGRRASPATATPNSSTAPAGEDEEARVRREVREKLMALFIVLAPKGFDLKTEVLKEFRLAARTLKNYMDEMKRQGKAPPR